MRRWLQIITDEFARYLAGQEPEYCRTCCRNLTSAGRRSATRPCETCGKRAIFRRTTLPIEVARFYRLPRVHAPATARRAARWPGNSRAASCARPWSSRSRPRAEAAALALADPNDDRGRARRRDRARRSRSRSRSPPTRTSRPILTKRLGEDDEAAPEATAARPLSRAPTTTSRACAIWRAARRSCAPSTTCSKSAMELRATDIHIEPFRSGLVVRMRVDGLLRAVPTPAGALPQALISRIKILAGLNIAERRLPQDGAARVRVARTEYRRPRRHHADAARRIRRDPPAAARPRPPRDRQARPARSHDEARSCSRLLDAAARHDRRHRPDRQSARPRRLRPCLSILNETTRKILTIEDPVEYEIHGVNQSQVRPLDRADLLQCAARLRAPGPGRHHGRRGARRRDRASSQSTRRSPAIWCSPRCTPRPPPPPCRACSISASRAFC